MKIVVIALKPRNPVAVAARCRRAGAHRPGTRSRRQHATQGLRRELDQLARPKPNP